MAADVECSIDLLIGHTLPIVNNAKRVYIVPIVDRKSVFDKEFNSNVFSARGNSIINYIHNS